MVDTEVYENLLKKLVFIKFHFNPTQKTDMYSKIMLQDELACLMITYPSTNGVFEDTVRFAIIFPAQLLLHQ